MRERERMERANRAAAWERRSGRRLHKSARRASFPAASKPDRGSTSSRDRWRLARRPCSCCPARHPARIMAHRTGRDVLRVPLPAAGKQAGDAVGAVWIYRPRSRLFARHPSRIAAHRARCRRFPAASNPGPAPRRGISGGQRRLARRPCSCCPARHPARILVLRWSAQDAAAEPYEYALDCASDRKAYAWSPLPRTPHPRLTRWQRAFYHPFLWRTLCYGKRLCGQGNGKAQALQRGRRERCQSGRAAHKGAARNHDGAQQKRLANAPA